MPQKRNLTAIKMNNLFPIIIFALVVCSNALFKSIDNLIILPSKQSNNAEQLLIKKVNIKMINMYMYRLIQLLTTCDLFKILLLLSGDVERNPGPNSNFSLCHINTRSHEKP